MKWRETISFRAAKYSQMVLDVMPDPNLRVRILDVANPFVVFSHPLKQHLHVELFLAPEIGVESPHGHAGDPGDLSDRRLFVALVTEYLEGRPEDFFPRRI